MTNETQVVHTKAVMKRENGIDFPARDYAFVPDPLASSSWRLRLTETPGKVTVEQLARAAAEISAGGFRGNRVDIPPSVLSSVKRRLVAEFRRLGVPDNQIPNSVKELSMGDDSGSGMMLWKEANTDRLRWLTIYSNNFRDDDNPSEIISEQSHKSFVELVDEGIVDYPELWLWHVPGTAWGKADWVAYADGFALASGYVYPGYESVAESLSKEADLRVSHGMFKALLVRNKQNRSVIDFHITHEISPLPGWAAANKLTSFEILDKGEATMPLPEDKVNWLKERGLTDEQIAALDGNITFLGANARKAGIESKEQSEAAEEVAQEQTEAETPAAEKAAKPKDGEEMEEGEEKETAKKESSEAAAETPVYATREEVAAAVTELVGPVLAEIKSISDQLTAATKELSELKKSDAEKVAALKEATPTRSQLSLSELIAQNLIGKETTRVDGRTALGKDSPAETKQAAPAFTGVPFVDQLIQGTQK